MKEKEESSDARHSVGRLSRFWTFGSEDEPALSSDPLFPPTQALSLAEMLLRGSCEEHALSASRSCSSLIGKRVSPHVLRHSTAMRLMHHGVDQSVISLWLGHESIQTTAGLYARGHAS